MRVWRLAYQAVSYVLYVDEDSRPRVCCVITSYIYEFVIQRRAARWITNKHSHTTSVTALLQQVRLEPLEERRRISRHKILNEHVAVSLTQLDLVV